MALPFVDAYRKNDGVKVRIPAHWFEIPSLAAPFALTPRQRAFRAPHTPGRSSGAGNQKIPNTPATGDEKE